MKLPIALLGLGAILTAGAAFGATTPGGDTATVAVESHKGMTEANAVLDQALKDAAKLTLDRGFGYFEVTSANYVLPGKSSRQWAGERITIKMSADAKANRDAYDAKLVASQPAAAAPPAVRAFAASRPSEFRDCAACATMVRIPAGSFTMGVPTGEEGYVSTQGPQREVSVRAFALGKYEVTQGEYAAFVRDTKRSIEPGCSVYTGLALGWEDDKAANWKNPGFAQTEREAVVCVSWDDAAAYAAWMAKKTGKPYRLATEAEWEYAARAGAKGKYYWGENADESCLYSNAADQMYQQRWPHQKAAQCTDGYLYTSPVGAFRPNAFGLYDMLGNAYEFVQDCYEASYGAQPRDGSAHVGGKCDRRVYRGGSWHNSALPGHDIRLGNRVGTGPLGRSHDHGFRIARDL